MLFRSVFLVGLILLVSASVPIIRGLPQAIPMRIAQIKENDRAQGDLKNLWFSAQKPIAFLIPDNSYRLLSIDSAIFKGGGAIYGGKFPDSPFIQKLFQDRTYFSGTSMDFRTKPLSLLDYGTIVFSILQSPGKNNYLDYYLSQIPKRIRELENYYNTTLQGHNCDNWVDFGENADPRLVVLCYQRTIRFQDVQENNGLIVLLNGDGYWYLAGEDEEKIKSKNGFVTDDEGITYRILASDGDVLRFTNVGPFNKNTGELEGLLAVYKNGQWVFQFEDWHPRNENSRFNKGSPKNPIPGYWISPGEIKATVSQLEDQTGAFVRITANSVSDYMVINGNIPLQTLNGEPVSIRAQMRVPRIRNASLTITDTINGSGESTSHQVTVMLPLNEWIPLIVRA